MLIVQHAIGLLITVLSSRLSIAALSLTIGRHLTILFTLTITLIGLAMIIFKESSQRTAIIRMETLALGNAIGMFHVTALLTTMDLVSTALSELTILLRILLMAPLVAQILSKLGRTEVFGLQIAQLVLKGLLMDGFKTLGLHAALLSTTLIVLLTTS